MTEGYILLLVFFALVGYILGAVVKGVECRQKMKRERRFNELAMAANDMMVEQMQERHERELSRARVITEDIYTNANKGKYGEGKGNEINYSDF